MSGPAAIKYAEREAKASPWDAKYYHAVRNQAVGEECLEEDIEVAFLAKTLFSSVNALSSQNERRQELVNEITAEKDEIIASKDRKISRRDNRIDRRNHKIAERDQTITSLTTDTLNLQEKINDAESKNAQLMERIRDQDRQNQILMKAFKDKKSEVEKKDTEIANLKKENARLAVNAANNEELKNEIANLKLELSEEKRKTQESEGEHKKRIENLEAQNNQLQESVEEMKKIMQSVVQEIAVLRKQNTAKDQEITKKTNELAEKDSIIKALTEASEQPFGFEKISDSN